MARIYNDPPSAAILREAGTLMHPDTLKHTPIHIHTHTHTREGVHTKADDLKLQKKTCVSCMTGNLKILIDGIVCLCVQMKDTRR